MSYVPPKPSDATARRRTVGVIGLGKMGGQIARHLIDDGMMVVGYDIRTEALTGLSYRGGEVAASPAALGSSVDVVITSLPSLEALTAVVRGADGLLAGAHTGLTVIETSTLTSEMKRVFRDEFQPLGVVMLDCPLSGTARQMTDRDVVVYASGDVDALRSQWHILTAFTRAQYNVGQFGNGSNLKLLSNLLVTVHNVAAAEVLVLAERAGLDLVQTLAALTDGAGTSRMLEVRGPMMIKKDYLPVSASLEEFMKDIELITAFAADSSSPLPLFKVSAQLYRDALQAGYGAVDHAVVADLIATLSPADPASGYEE